MFLSPEKSQVAKEEEKMFINEYSEQSVDCVRVLHSSSYLFVCLWMGGQPEA